MWWWLVFDESLRFLSLAGCCEVFYSSMYKLYARLTRLFQQLNNFSSLYYLHFDLEQVFIIVSMY